MNITRILTLGTTLLGLAGCAIDQTTDRQTTNGFPSTHSIELLYFDGCPNTPAMRDSLEYAVVHSAIAASSLERTDLTTLPQGDLRRGYGSPTILVDGHDLFGASAPASPNMSCRIYPDGLPTTQTVIAKLNEYTP